MHADAQKNWHGARILMLVPRVPRGRFLRLRATGWLASDTFRPHMARRAVALVGPDGSWGVYAAGRLLVNNQVVMVRRGARHQGASRQGVREEEETEKVFGDDVE